MIKLEEFNKNNYFIFKNQNYFENYYIIKDDDMSEYNIINGFLTSINNDYEKFLDTILAGVVVDNSFNIKLKKIYDSICLNTKKLYLVYDFINNSVKGNLSITLNKDFSFKSLRLNLVITYFKSNKDIHPSIYNLTITLDKNISNYNVRKDFDTKFDLNNLPVSLFCIMQNSELINIIDDIYIDYTWEEMIEFNTLLSMTKF